MNRRGLIVGGLLVAAVAFFLVRLTPDKTPQISEETPITSEETENRLEEVLGRTIAEDAEKATLKDLTNSGMVGIATRVIEAGVVEFSVLADLEEPEQEVYQVWVGASQGETRSLGTLTPAKGGYLFDYRQSGSLEDYNYVVVSREALVDEIMETKILEGSF